MEQVSSRSSRSPSPPREAPTSWSELPDEGFLEEEGFSWYAPDKWLSVEIGQVFENRYQVLLKLGYGSVSTAWLCRDLQIHRYVTLKVYETGHRQALNENKVLEHLRAKIESQEDNPGRHPGADFVRLALDKFEVPGVAGPHVCIVHQPLSLTLKDMREMADGQLPEEMLKPFVGQMLVGLDFLHSVANVVHTDIQEGNFLLSVTDESFFDEAVTEEWASPIPRKKRNSASRVVHASTPLDMPDDPGAIVITDFGDAKFGSDDDYVGEVMPDLYRAPEIIFRISWDSKIDIWAFGLLVWDLFEGKHLFNERLPSRDASAGAHLARMISLLGPPPKDLLDLNKGATAEFFDEDGAFKFVDKVTETSLEAEEENMDEGSEEKAKFLAFLRKMLQWRSKDRLPAIELLEDSWLWRQ